MAEENKPEKQKRRRLSAEDKVKILSDILLKGRDLSELADEYKIRPNKILEWRKELFESATGIFGCSPTSHASWRIRSQGSRLGPFRYDVRPER